MHFEDFVLQLDASSRGGFRARVVKSPFGEAAVGFSLPVAAGAEAAAMGAVGTSRDIVQEYAVAVVRDERSPQEIGAEIFRTVFQGQVRTLLDKSRGKIEMSSELGLRLKIKLDPGDADTAALADLPWELLCDGEDDDFFALSRRTSVVRYLDVPRPSQPIPFTPPLRILAVGASPQGLPPLDLEEEAKRLAELHQSAAGVEVRFLGHASAGAVREALAGDIYNVIHFMGHGVFDRASGEGMLAFEGADGRVDLVSGRAFATKIRDLRSLGVVVLNACNTARAGGQEGLSPFRGVASALVLGGVPAVVAMQRPISDRAAIGFSAAFYRHVARGDSIDEALTEGRQAIHSAAPNGFEWATPVLFLRIPEGNVFVAKPAEAPAAPVEIPGAAAVAAVAAAPPVVAAPVAAPLPVATGGRHGTAFKIAVGAAGTGLLAGTLYFVVPKSPVAPDAGTNPMTTGVMTTGQPPGTDGGGSGSSAPAPAPVNHHKPGLGGQAPSTSGAGSATGSGGSGQPVTPPITSPDKPIPTPPPPEPAAAADLSGLTSQAVSLARRDSGGLRVTVAFRNSAGLPLSVVLDGESVELSDNQGQRYSVMSSDLPAAGGGNRLLKVAAGGAATVHFDFQMPKLGSSKFYLAVATQDGKTIPVSGFPLTLDAQP